LGLNGGIHDAIELVDTLHQVITRQSNESLLDRYTRRRRTLNIEFVQEQTITNKKRLEERDSKARQARFDELRAMGHDPQKHKEFLLRTSLIASVRKAQRWISARSERVTAPPSAAKIISPVEGRSVAALFPGDFPENQKTAAGVPSPAPAVARAPDLCC
jgi:hypothetical protein